MSIQTLKIPFTGEFIKEGDTILETVLDITNAGDLTTANSIIMQIKDGSSNVIDVSVGSGLTVMSATRVVIDEVPFANNNLRDGCFLGDFQITIGGIKKTYMNVEYNIIKDYAK